MPTRELPRVLIAFSVLFLALGLAGDARAVGPWGDGSAGDLVVSQDATLGEDVAGDGNYQFRRFRVEPGVTLRVASGTVIRCRIYFGNHGVIEVLPGERGGVRSGSTEIHAGSGVSHRAPGTAGVGDLNLDGQGALGGVGLSEAEARTLRYVGPSAGGGGGASGVFGAGGLGGGSLLVLARWGVFNRGIIQALPEPAFGLPSPGDGGGAGGVLILGARYLVSNEGRLLASGGDGEPGGVGGTYVATGGGGGGGGIVHLVAPWIHAGDVDVSGGDGGAGSEPSSSARRSGGGAGGASGGDGGQGGSIQPQTASPGFPGADGQDGHLIETRVNPAGLF